MCGFVNAVYLSEYDDLHNFLHSEIPFIIQGDYVPSKKKYFFDMAHASLSVRLYLLPHANLTTCSLDFEIRGYTCVNDWTQHLIFSI